MSKLFKSTMTVLVAMLALGGCASTTKSTKTSLELQAIQSQMFETSKDVAFPSTLSVFQDLGYIIESADKETGFITASSATQNTTGFFAAMGGHSQSSKTKATAFVEQLTPEKAKVRLNFVIVNKGSSAYGRESQQDTVIEDPKVYESAFNKIGDAIFIRTAN
ncbi:MAG: hypothetical protein ACPF9E_18850 [Alteromonas oceani]